MTVRRSGVLVAVLAVLFTAAIGRPPAVEAQTGFFGGQNIASHTYYTLDPTNASIAVRMEASVASGNDDDLSTVSLLAMPEARDIDVRQDGTPLIVTNESVDIGDFGDVKIIEATLLKPLRGALTAEIVMTYTVSSGTEGITTVSSGMIETPFVSQGPGSFVSIDLPPDADNYIDPGCVLAVAQPDSGLERWVCGETLFVSLSADDPETVEKCARLDDRCRQASPITHIAFVQSITDPALVATLHDTVQLSDREVTIELHYLRGQADWANAQFETAKRAFPDLERLFGYPFNHDQIVLRQSNYIGLLGIDGVAFSRLGEVLITYSGDIESDRGVTIHELAHQWSTSHRYETSWLSEGQAEWANQVLSAQYGIPVIPWGWESLGYTDPVGRWRAGSEISDPAYWYGKSAAFWFAYESAIGGRDNMTAVLGQVDDAQEQWPLGGRWFMDAGERVSNVNLDALFLEWVFAPETATEALLERRAVWDARGALTMEAASRGLSGEPAGIRPNLDTWNFDAATRDIAAARSALLNYDNAVGEAAAAGLPMVPEAIQAAWAEGSLTELRAIIEEQRTAIRTIADSVEALAAQPENPLALAALERAREAYRAGDFSTAAEQASQAVTDSLNLAAAGRMIEAAEARQAEFDPNFMSNVGLLWRDPAAQLQDARLAYEEGRGTDALRLATAAYETWGGAQRDGMFRLALAAGAACALFVLVAFVIGKRQAKLAVAAQHAESIANRSTWRDLENTK